MADEVRFEFIQDDCVSLLKAKTKTVENTAKNKRNCAEYPR